MELKVMRVQIEGYDVNQVLQHCNQKTLFYNSILGTNYSIVIECAAYNEVEIYINNELVGNWGVTETGHLHLYGPAGGTTYFSLLTNITDILVRAIGVDVVNIQRVILVS
jgi:hypothetical protein